MYTQGLVKSRRFRYTLIFIVVKFIYGGRINMAKKDVVIFICDCCKKEFQFDNKVKNSPLREVYIPSKIFDCEGRGYTKGISKVELCDDCYSEFWDYVQQKYKVEELYDVHMEKRC